MSRPVYERLPDDEPPSVPATFYLAFADKGEDHLDPVITGPHLPGVTHCVRCGTQRLTIGDPGPVCRQCKLERMGPA